MSACQALSLRKIDPKIDGILSMTKSLFWSHIDRAFNLVIDQHGFLLAHVETEKYRLLSPHEFSSISPTSFGRARTPTSAAAWRGPCWPSIALRCPRHHRRVRPWGFRGEAKVKNWGWMDGGPKDRKCW